MTISSTNNSIVSNLNNSSKFPSWARLCSSTLFSYS